jgi:hypothetical protein
MDRDLKAILLIYECIEAVRSLRKKFPKLRCFRKLVVYIERMQICYEFQDYNSVIEIGEWVFKIYYKFISFWGDGGRIVKYNSKNNKLEK